jgi:hypothetical protein
MSASEIKYEMRQMYDFKKVYDVIGGRGNPVLTRERFENILQQLQLLYTTGKATNTSIYGDTMELTLKEDPTDPAFKILGHKHSNGTEANMKVGPNDRIYITNNGILNLHIIWHRGCIQKNHIAEQRLSLSSECMVS